jgi:type IV secretory pathway TraG/TraD family ATPase VirD4
VYLSREDRLRHFYTIGQTGTGKTNLLRNMIKQDIKRGDGCCFIDPHGDAAHDILAHVPERRFDDVIYFDPAHTDRPMGLNMLEYDKKYPEQKTFVVDEMMNIFNKLFNLDQTGGPMFEQYFRNGALLALEDQESGSTILEISRVLSDAEFRQRKLAASENEVVNQFWTEIAEEAGGESSLENIVPYVTSKFDNFLSNEIMRPIIAQQESSFDFREVMDNQKILIVNLSKGRLGDINANLIGLILVGKILMNALSRVDMPEEERKPFYLYMDEFQNISTDSISAILSEARKYKLSLNVAHQYIDQLDEEIRDAVFGNVGNMATHRISTKDAEFMEDMYQPIFDQKDLMNVDNYNYFANILVDGEPVKPFSARAVAPTEGNPDQVEKLKQLSYLKYGRPREEVEAEVKEKIKNM